MRFTPGEPLSLPPLQAPSGPRVLAEATAPMGLDLSTPEYLATAMTAFQGVELKVAVTIPFPPGEPMAIQTSVRDWTRPLH